MTDNTNIEKDEIRAFMDQYHKENPEAAKYSDAKIQYNLDRGWILGWCMARCAAFSNAEPTAWRVTMPNGKERGIWSNYDDVEISISGLEGNIITPLFLHPSVPAPKVTTVLVYRDKGRLGVGGQTIGANGAGEFAVIYYDLDEVEANIHARSTIRGLETRGHKITEAFIVSGEGYHGPVITHVGLPLTNIREQK